MPPDWRRNRPGAYLAQQSAVLFEFPAPGPVECQVAGFSWIRFKVEEHFGGLALGKHHLFEALRA